MKYLSYLKIVELASVLAGPDVGMFFAELGAQVIKIENKTTYGDVTRSWKLPEEDKNASVSAYFSSINYGKIHHFINLKEKKGYNQVISYIKHADIVITNFKFGDDIKLGLDFNSLKKINPALIYGRITGYGATNKRTAYDVVLQAETGFMSMNGAPNSVPIKMPVALIDVLAAHQLKEGLLLALFNKEKTGKGALVETSLYASAIASLKNQASNWLMCGHVAKKIGSLHPNIAPYGETFLTKDDKYIVLAIGNDKHFRLMLELIGAEDLISEQQYKENSMRVLNRAKLFADLKPFFLKKNREDLIRLFIRYNVPAGAVRTIDEVFENPDAKKMILEEEIDGVHTKRVQNVVFKISE